VAIQRIAPMECVFDPFLKYNVKMLLRDSNGKKKLVKDISKPTTGKEWLCDISNDNDVKRSYSCNRLWRLICL
jgi:hypothetical protein